MKALVLVGVFLLVHLSVLAENDTSAYNTQRNKINQLLAERSAKFGEYDSSLRRKSGIFGSKTKKDMQASNDILTQIVINDNNIFTELKTLLDYKDFEKKEVETRAETVESRIERYQSTITRLQQENERLKSEIDKQKAKSNRFLFYLIGLLFALLIAVFYVFRSKKLPKADI